MIVEIGHYALALALGVSVIQAVVPFWGVFRQDRTLASVGSSAPRPSGNKPAHHDKRYA